jgi:hypothetical protein
LGGDSFGNSKKNTIVDGISIEKHIYYPLNRQVGWNDGQMNGWMGDGLVDRWKGKGLVDGWMVGWING